MNSRTNAQNYLGVAAPILTPFRSIPYALFLLLSYLCVAFPGFAQAAPATPWFSPGSGTYSYSGGISVTISDSTSGVSIYYTTDGSTPTANSTLYSGPIAVPAVPATKTFKAIAILNGVSSYSVASATYTITPPAPTPTYSPAPNTYVGSQTVSISSSVSGAVIRYTLDGSTPTSSSPVYNGPFTVSQNINILAYVASAPGYSSGSASRGHYIITVPTPTITPTAGTFTTAPTITMKDSLAGASIYYTLDGSTPSSWATLYTGPFPLTATTLGAKTIQAIAISNNMGNSAIAQSSLTLSLPKGVIATALVAPTASDTIGTDFLGFSHDWRYTGSMIGTASAGSNPLFPALVKNLTDNMNGPLVLRVGADGTDVSGAASATTMQPLIELGQKANVKWILGVNLGSDDVSLAQEQASTFAASIPAASLMALEVGNEPDIYSTNGLRSSSYDFSSFLPEYQQWQQALTSTTGGKAPIAGPTLGTGNWNISSTTAVTTGTMKADLLTQHEYLVCYDSNNLQPSDYLLQPSSAQMHLYSLVPYVNAVESTNIPFRVAEMNSLCSGGQPGLSNSFSSALWGIDTMFEYANIGVDGVNWMTGYLGGAYDLFQFSLWKRSNGMNAFTLASVRPLYYGLLFFSRAAGNNAQLFPSYMVTGSNVKIWITTDSNGKAHLVLINKDKTATGNIQVTLPGYSRGTVTRLAASGGYTATNGVTFGGQTFDNSTDGTIGGTLTTESVTPSNNVWTVSIQPTTAVLVDLQP